VAEHAGDFGFALRREQQTGVDADKTAGQRKRVDLRIAHHKKIEFLLGFGAVHGQPPAQAVGVIGNFRVIDIGRITADFVHDALAQPPLVGGTDGRARTVAHVGQRLRQHARDAKQHQQDEETPEHGAMIILPARSS